MQQSMSSMFNKLAETQRIFALVIGIFFLFIGIAGFIPGFMPIPESAPTAAIEVPRLVSSEGYGLLFGLFPTNFVHNAVHIVVGLLGIAAATSFTGALVYNQGFAIAYTAIALLGLIPFTNTTFGLMPIYGNNVWLNAITAIAAAYIGFVKPAELAKMETPNPSS